MDSERMAASRDVGYTGSDNLAVMAEAVKYNRFLISLVRDAVRAPAKLLDIGAGIGTFAAMLADGGFSVTCVEPDVCQAAAIRARGLPVHDALACVPDSEFDFIYSFNVLEHIEDDAKALGEWRRKLRPGGKALVYVPAFQVLYSSMDAKVGHYRRYRRGELTSKMERAGFRVIAARYADSIGFAASLAFRMVGSKSGDINRRALIAYDRWVFPVSRAIDVLAHHWVGKNLVALAAT